MNALYECLAKEMFFNLDLNRESVSEHSVCI